MEGIASIVIAAPRDAADYEAIAGLMVEYAESLGFSLEYQGFEAELKELPGRYAEPAGALLLARVDGVAAGMVGMRGLGEAGGLGGLGLGLGEGICEMKRLYVRPELRGVRDGEGRTIGRALAVAVVEAARAVGYRRMRLDTIAGTMDAAMRLYRSMGFVEIGAYYESPVAGTVYMELVL
jgi:putative acetyltransferase